MRPNKSLEQEKELLSKRLVSLKRFHESCKEMSFYTSFPNYATFWTIYDSINPGLQGENIRYCNQSDSGVPDDYYNDQDTV